MINPNLAARWSFDRKTAVLILYVIAIWLFTHGYHGISHDGLFYAVQALFHLDPGSFRQDLFFLFGSQDDFTLFGRVYAILIAWFGLNRATVGLLLAAQAFWIVGAVAVIRQIYKDELQWSALVLLIALPSHYGSERVFSYAESVLTARLLAEAFSLAGIALAMAGRTGLSLALCALAALFHPIMALPAIAFAILSRLRFGAAVALVLSSLILLGVMVSVPTSYLPGRLGIMDDVWYALAVEHSPFSFIDQWTAMEYGEILLLVTVLGYAALRAPEPLRGAARTVLLITTALLTAAWVGTVTHHAILIQAQFWRVLWLTKIFAILVAVWLFAQYWGRSRYHKLVLAGLAVTALAPRVISALVAAEMSIGLIVVAVVGIHLIWVLLLVPVLPGGWLVEGKKWQLLALVFVLEFLLLSVYWWDRRKMEPMRVCRETPGCLAEIDHHLPKNAVIYWQDAFEIAWFVLRRPHYGSSFQAAGLLYHRETAIEARRRVARLEKLGVLDGIFDWHRMTLKNKPKPQLKFDGLVHVCHDPAVDFLVLEGEFQQASPRAFDEPLLNTRFFVYDCRLVRERFTDPYAALSMLDHFRNEDG